MIQLAKTFSKAWWLTAGTDTLVGGSSADVFNASIGLAADGTTAIATTNAIDSINGGAGIDTLNIENTGSVNSLAGTYTNIENLTFIGSGTVNKTAAAATGADIDVTPFSGTITLKQTDDTTVTLTNVTGQTLALNAVATGTTLTAGLAATQASVSLSSLAAVGNATFNVAGAGLKTANLSVDKTAAGTAVTVADTGTTNTIEAANITATGASTVTVTSSALKTVTVAGAGLVTLTTTTAPTTSVDASASTGGVNLVTALANTATFTGGAGKDTLTVGANTHVIALGAGDDSVTWTAAALGAGGSIDGGAGSDTVSLTAANAATATSTATLGAAFAASVSNFEKFGVGATGTTPTVIDAQYIDGITQIVSAGSSALGTLTVNNLSANSTFESTAAQAAAVTLNLKDTTGLSDVLNLKFSAADGFANTTAGVITAAGVETLNITTLDTDTTAPTTVFDAEVAATSVKSVVVAGNVGIDLTGLTAVTLTSFDASGVTATGAAGAVTLTTGALTAVATLTGGAGNDLINAAAATKAVTLTGGAGIDTLTGSATVASILNGGEGNDILNGGAAADTINGGAGNDVISGGKGLDVLTGGAGNDTFNIVFNTNGNIYASITDAAAGDILNFANSGTETFTTAAITLGSTAVFQDYLNQAALSATGDVNGVISWFQFSGNTYVVEDVSAGTSFVNGADSVVQLTGLVNLANAVVGDHALTIA